MMFDKRRHCVSQVDSAEQLAEKLSGGWTWTLCTGFRHGDLLYLNDSTGPDGAQEYAVIRDPGKFGPQEAEQVETVTFSWMTQDAALNLIRQYEKGEALCEPWPTQINIESPATHVVCGNCA